MSRACVKPMVLGSGKKLALAQLTGYHLYTISTIYEQYHLKLRAI